MPKIRTPVEKAAGKLISEIQKVWGEQLGESNAEFSQNVMDSAHYILQAGSAEEILKLLDSLTITQYLGEVWVRAHAEVKPAIEKLEAAIAEELNSKP